MNISKISRSIVVVIFVVVILFLGGLNTLSLFDGGDDVASNVTSTFIKFGFVLAIIIFTCIYVYIKDKLYKKHIKRNLSFIYRYIYIIFMILGASIFSLRDVLLIFPEYKIFLHMIFVIITALLIKKIIFNVSKSDILSVLAMCTYAFFPNIILEEKFYLAAMIFNILFLSYLLVFQILIDELKQKGLKNKKYIIQTIMLGFFMAFASVIGANVYIFVAIFIVAIFVTYNLDNTHINFPNKLMSSLTQAKREALYKIERININKLFVVILLSLVILFVCNSWFISVINNIDVSNNTISVIKSLNKEINFCAIDFNNVISSVIKLAKEFVSSAPLFYIVIFAYILFMEILAFCLKRKYDTKSTIMKFIFISLFIFIVLFNLNIYYFEPLLTILLILIAIVNTSNIYLNREERVKMLVA